jgi:hypothetical protein
MRKNAGNLKLSKNFLFVVTLCCVAGLLPVYWFLSRETVPHNHASLECSTNMSGLVKSLIVYDSIDANEILPPGESWCDVIVTGDYTTPKQFLCRSTDAVLGESSYALNKNVAGKKHSELAPETVMVFETNYGKLPDKRDATLSERLWFKTMPHYGHADMEVYEKRWNQSGGPELVATDHHEFEGSFFAFADASVRWVKKKDIAKLKWGN